MITKTFSGLAHSESAESNHLATSFFDYILDPASPTAPLALRGTPVAAVRGRYRKRPGLSDLRPRFRSQATANPDSDLPIAQMWGRVIR